MHDPCVLSMYSIAAANVTSNSVRHQRTQTTAQAIFIVFQPKIGKCA